MALQCMLNVCPGSNHGAEHHEAKREKGNPRDGATEPDDFAIGDQNNGQVLEDGVDGDRKVLQGLGTGVDHDDQKE